ncbi:MAG: helix-turn-helix domain-containing protein [Albidovulum sp.]|nr:helix-turn-helix domain-containing protein [Albidovulum sp.]MDE0532780.1 helix-turn-helix domain-containing protein [Albidovulum sp.]
MAYAPRALTVGVLLLADYQLSTVATFSDTLQCAAERLGKDICRSVLMSPAGKPAVSICGRSLTTESAQLWPENFSYLAIVGEYRSRLGMPEHTIQRYIQSADRLDVPLVGIGNGVATLARFGFLDGREACSSAATLPKWKRQFPGATFRTGQLIVEDGNRITSLGGAVGGDLAALLLVRHFGRRLARRAVAGIMLDHARHPSAPPPSQFAVSRPADIRVAQAIDAMNANVPDPVPLAAIAGMVGLSTRQLDRLFIAEIGKSSSRAYLAIRIERALELLSQTILSVTEIAHATGFVDGAHLAKTLKKSEGLTPREIRSGVVDGRLADPAKW